MELARNPNRLKLDQLLSSSEILRLAIWIDGQYTPLEVLTNGTWAEGRELFFRIEGRIKQKSPDA